VVRRTAVGSAAARCADGPCWAIVSGELVERQARRSLGSGRVIAQFGQISSRMKELSVANFGILIAYVLPGFTALWGVSYFSETVQVWLGSSPGDAPTIGGFLYVTLAAVGAGMTVSTVRWMIVDTIHALTGLPHPRWDFSRLQDNVDGYDVLVRIHYHFYQFNANMLVAAAFLFVARCISLGWSSFFDVPVVLGFLALEVIFFVGSRDTIRKYYSRVAKLLGTERGQPTR